MKEIKFGQLLRIYYVSSFAQLLNKKNEYFKNEYSNFFDSNTNLKYEDFLAKKLQLKNSQLIKWTNYLPIFNATSNCIKQICAQHPETKDIVDISDFSTSMNNLLSNRSNDMSYDNIILSISDETHFRLFNYVVDAFFYCEQRYYFLPMRNDVLKELPQSLHEPFSVLHSEIQGKRLCGSFLNSFFLLQEYFKESGFIMNFKRFKNKSMF